MSKELVAWAKDIAKSHRLNFDDILQAVEEALAVSVRRQYDGERSFRVELDPKTGAQKIYRQWKIVEEVTAPTKELSLEAALLEDPNAKPGDFIEDLDDMEVVKLDRINFIAFRQIITTKIRELERQKILDSYRPFLGKIITGTVRKSLPNQITVALPVLDSDDLEASSEGGYAENKTIEAVIRKDDMIPGERYRANQPIRALLVALESDPNSRQVAVLSRSKPEFVQAILEKNIPEVINGTVKIHKIVRDPGVRCKISVESTNESTDAIGAIVGVKSGRIQPIIQELSGERIDVIEYAEDLPTYLYNALCQPEIEKIILDEEKKSIDVAVDKKNLSVTIGKAGVNTSLASRLLGWKIHVWDVEEYDAQQEQKQQTLLTELMEGLEIDEESALYLIEQGYKSVRELAEAELSELEELVDEDQAVALKELAESYLQAKVDAQENAIKEAGIEDKLLELDGMTSELALKLANKEIKTLEDLADQATDDLDKIMSRPLANSLIMQARQICWFSEEE